MITLYGSATSPNVLKVRLLLIAAEIPYQEHRVRREDGENKAPEFLKISPTGTMPAIVDDETGANLFESSAILLYIADRCGKFLPSEPIARADVLKWLIFETANVGPVMENIYKLYYLDAEWVAPALEFQRDRLRIAVSVLDARLAEAEFIADEISIADFVLVPLINLLEDFLEQPLSDFPGLERWSKTLMQQPAVLRAMGRE